MRSYPVGFAKALLEVYETHNAQNQNLRDLRFKVQLDGPLNPLDQFDRIPLGDIWDDAQLLIPGPLKYLYHSKLLR